ncbi:MAG: transposase [Gemmataceae bacterium]
MPDEVGQPHSSPLRFRRPTGNHCFRTSLFRRPTSHLSRRGPRGLTWESTRAAAVCFGGSHVTVQGSSRRQPSGSPPTPGTRLPRRRRRRRRCGSCRPRSAAGTTSASSPPTRRPGSNPRSGPRPPAGRSPGSSSGPGGRPTGCRRRTSGSRPPRPGRAADRNLLATIPGVGSQTTSTVRVELPALDRIPSAQAVAAYCGLSPREFRSGASVRRRTRLSKAGNARLRKGLYLPTLTAVRFNPLLEAFFDRLVAAGKPKMQAIGACMRKLVMICYGVLKHRAPFDPAWASRIAP